ncbi:alpha-amlyase [Marinilabiliaceae bacterium JC017]|nr:alpha-amlyase [Marinilabiliaceae bacterium JC017]
MRITTLWVTMILITQGLFGAWAFGKNKTTLKKIEPMNWWIGMTNPNLQLMAYGSNIAKTDVKVLSSHIRLKQTIKVENPNYLFLDLVISDNAKPGIVPIQFMAGKKVIANCNFELKTRADNSKQREGFSSKDAIYLIMPDRFANGNPANDDRPGMLEKANRQAPYGRHGGDLKGISNHLDFIKAMGFTAIWLNPVQENNQPAASYHGYAITDYYHVDARLGTNNEFKQLVDQCQAKGIKMIMDMVFNHCGDHHWWMNDLPSHDWLNQFEEFTRSNYRLSTVSDPYASKEDLKKTIEGWFDNSMPDLNLQNPLLLNYLIQNSIWWIEHAGLQGIRMDTYPYPDKDGMATWAQRILTEYPNFNIVGESWISQASKLCYWQKDYPNKDGYNSHLPSLMDFPLMEALKEAFNEADAWDKGLNRLYDVLADDHLYPDPMNLVVFPENHDIGRLYFFLGNDLRKFKMAMAFIATIRGIPQLYYGSELLMDGNGFEGHANIREDFPGGWPADKINAFTPGGRTNDQNEAIDYITKLLTYRKESEVLHQGKLLHFIPEEEVYVYFRYLEDKAVMVILNNADASDKKIITIRFAEILQEYNHGKDIMTGKTIDDLSTIISPAKSATIIELTK